MAAVAFPPPVLAPIHTPPKFKNVGGHHLHLHLHLDHPTLALLARCSTPAHLHQIHAHMLRTGLFFHSFFSTRLLAAAAAADPDYADRLLRHIPRPNLFCFNTLIRAHAAGPSPRRSVAVFVRLLRRLNGAVDSYTFPFLVKAAAELADFGLGSTVHGMVCKSGFATDVFVLNSLIHLYGSCSRLDLAYREFDRIPSRDCRLCAGRPAGRGAESVPEDGWGGRVAAERGDLGECVVCLCEEGGD